MSKVFVSVGLSLDGFIAGSNRGPQNPLGDGGREIHGWAFRQKAFLQRLNLPGGEEGRDGEIVAATFDRIGANIMGRRMFNEGEASWPEDAPFRTPVYVLTSSPRDPWQRPGGTTFYFETGGIRPALEKAKAAAGKKDVRISGGAHAIRQYLSAGLVDELHIQLAPVVLGSGLRLFDYIDPDTFSLTIEDVVASPLTTHLQYRVSGR